MITIERVEEIYKNGIYKIWIRGNNKRNEKKSFYAFAASMCEKLNLDLDVTCRKCVLRRGCTKAPELLCDYIRETITTYNSIYPVSSSLGRKYISAIKNENKKNTEG